MKTTARLVDPAAVGDRNVSLQPARHRSVELILTLLCWISAAQIAAATTRTVTSLNDDGGAGTLRFLITASAAGDTINFAVSGTITLTSGELLIGRNLTITGPGAKLLTVNGNNASRVFNISSGITVNISGLTISNGSSTVFGDPNGGGIYNVGTLTINNCTLSGNSTTAVAGGIYNGGTVTINNSTFSGNSGSGIYNGGTATINNSTFSGNYSGASPGGAINNGGTVTINNCTISGNSALANGGGIVNSSSLIIINTIVANNTVLDVGYDGPDVSGPVSSHGRNLVGRTDGSSGWISSDLPTLGGTTDATRLDPQLGPLQDNGGPTFTMALLPTSAAIDAGDDAVLGLPLLRDQRGRPRWSGAHVDIGAYEVGPPPVVTITNDSGAGSLREAILLAAPGDPINFSPNVTGTITLTSGELLFGKNLTINGPGAKVLTISGNNVSRVFHITGGVSTISNLRIANGNTSGGGGGILMDAGTLNLNYCTVAACYAGNTSGGGGIFLASSASLSLVGSTISGNSTPEYGGGLYLFNGAQATVRNSTISGNSTLDGTDAGWGGGIFVQSSGSTLSLFNSTVANNSSVNAGGGIYRYQGTVTLADTLVAGNNAPSGPDCKGTFVSSGYNLIGNSSGSTGFSATSDQLNLNAMIGPLADNGGPTFTHALLTGSPAIDKGNRFGATTDQRGSIRPYDFPSVLKASGGDESDIGAFELNLVVVNPPLLTIRQSGTNVLISWSTDNPGYTLETKTNLSPAVLWTTVPGTPATVGSQFVITNGPATGNKFYRLKQ